MNEKEKSILSVIRGVGEVDVYENIQKYFSSPSKSSFSEHVDSESNDRPYLIVDLRDDDAFKTNHIISGSFI